MSYQTFAHTGKTLVKSEDIGPGQIQLSHLSPALFSEIRMIQLHNHSGVGSVRLNLSGTEGFFPLTGYKMIAANGNKYQVTISNTGVLTTTQIT